MVTNLHKIIKIGQTYCLANYLVIYFLLPWYSEVGLFFLSTNHRLRRPAAPGCPRISRKKLFSRSMAVWSLRILYAKCTYLDASPSSSPFIMSKKGYHQGRCQPLTPGRARSLKMRSFPQSFLIFLCFSHFSSNFLHFLPHFGLPGGRAAYPGRPWLRYWLSYDK